MGVVIKFIKGDFEELLLRNWMNLLKKELFLTEAFRIDQLSKI